MIDQTRLFLYQRYTKFIINDVTREQLQITLSVTLMTWVMSFFLQFWENMYNYNNGDYAMITHYYDIFFFMMTTLSTVGYGSSVQSDISKTSIIIFIVACVVIIPGQCERLVVLINSKSPYARKWYKKIEKVPFIVLIGRV